MKTGRSIQELAAELQRQADAKKDYLAPTSRLALLPPAATEDGAPQEVTLSGLNGEPMPMSDYAHGQVSSETGIPKKYYDLMRVQAPGLLAQNVNHWFQAEPKKRLVRTMDGRVRGFLSDKFRPLDNLDLAEAALPTLTSRGCEIVSSEVTERRLYIKAVLPSMQAEVIGSKRKGDIVRAGIVFSNSEIGAGRLLIEDFFDLLACTNGMITTSTFAKLHLGRAYGEEHVRELLTSETRNQNDKAFWMTVRDVVANAFNEESFQQSVAKFSLSTGRKIEGNVEKSLEVVQELFTLKDETRGNVMRHLIEGGDLSQWGLSNAITRSAEDEEDYDEATALERAGGQIIELSPSQWTTIAKAA